MVLCLFGGLLFVFYKYNMIDTVELPKLENDEGLLAEHCSYIHARSR